MIAELACTLGGVEWRPVGSLNRDMIQTEMRQAIQLLQMHASSLAAHEGLSRYVATSFEELLA
jgi:hypothetical protein